MAGWLMWSLAQSSPNTLPFDSFVPVCSSGAIFASNLQWELLTFQNPVLLLQPEIIAFHIEKSVVILSNSSLSLALLY